jgi:hypothetical protein
MSTNFFVRLRDAILNYPSQKYNIYWLVGAAGLLVDGAGPQGQKM